MLRLSKVGAQSSLTMKIMYYALGIYFEDEYNTILNNFVKIKGLLG